MRKDLLPSGRSSYKANLHAHSNYSDGCLTPAQLKEAYRSRGYAVVAFSDHEYLLDHSDLTDRSFLALTSYELQITDMTVECKLHRKSTHLNLFARDPHNVTQIYFNPKYFFCGDQSLIPTLTYVGSAQAERYHTPECINDIIRRANDLGFIVSYNHPNWSLDDITDYGALHGLFAMEIYNTSCDKLGFHGYNRAAYDEMLRSGQRLGCIATDDNHNKLPFDHPLNDSFGGFTMLSPREFSYEAVIDAMDAGDYYASTGPLISELYYEDGKIKISCSPAKAVTMITYGRRTATIQEKDVPLEHAEFSINESDVYVRIEVADHEGRYAFSRAYFLSEFLKYE